MFCFVVVTSSTPGYQYEQFTYVSQGGPTLNGAIIRISKGHGVILMNMGKISLYLSTAKCNKSQNVYNRIALEIYRYGLRHKTRGINIII